RIHTGAGQADRLATHVDAVEMGARRQRQGALGEPRRGWLEVLATHVRADHDQPQQHDGPPDRPAPGTAHRGGRVAGSPAAGASAIPSSRRKTSRSYSESTVITMRVRSSVV